MAENTTKAQQQQSSKTTIKTNGKEFKALIKECLKELIMEGALNHLLPQHGQQSQPIQVVDPRVQYAAQVGAQVGGGNKIYENIFADTMLNTLPQQQANDPQALMANPYVQPMGMYNNNGYQQQQPQYIQPQQQQYVQQQPMQQPQFLNSGYQPQYAPQQPQHASNWARLAFAKSNGPSILSGMMSR
jgi:hypothetical protein